MPAPGGTDGPRGIPLRIYDLWVAKLDGGAVPDLVREVCDEPGVEFAVAFGSQVAGEFRPGSDVDVAVTFTDELAEHERFQLRCSLSGSLQHSNAPLADVSDVETLPIAIAHRALDGEFV